jgi:hypothetical protein
VFTTALHLERTLNIDRSDSPMKCKVAMSKTSSFALMLLLSCSSSVTKQGLVGKYGSPKWLVGQIGRLIWMPEQQRKTMAMRAEAE